MTIEPRLNANIRENIGPFALRPAKGTQDGQLYTSEFGISAWDAEAGVWRGGGSAILPITTIYLDPVAGNDANPGTITLPVKTLQRAYDLTGQAASSTIQIVGPLLALGALPLSSFTLPKASKRVVLQGAPATSLDGLIHTVQSSTAYNPATLAFVKVTPTDVIGVSPNGYFIRYLTGSLAGQSFPIDNITLGVLQLQSIAQPSNGDTFVIETPTTQVTWTNFFVQELEAQNLRWRNLTLNAPAGGFITTNLGEVSFEECLIDLSGVSVGFGTTVQIGTDSSGQIFDADFSTMGCFFVGDLSGQGILSIANVAIGGTGMIGMSQQGGAVDSSLYMYSVTWNGSGKSSGGTGTALEAACVVNLVAVSFACNNVSSANAKSILLLTQAQGSLKEVQVKDIPGATTNCDAVRVDSGSRIKMQKVIGISGAPVTPGFGLACGWNSTVGVADPNTGTTISVNGQDVGLGGVGLKSWAQIAGGLAADTTDNTQQLCTVH